MSWDCSNKTAGLDSAEAQNFLQYSLARGDEQGWWFKEGRLYQVWIQPIYFGETQTLLGYSGHR